MHKQLRLAWHGPTKCWAIVQLYNERDCGTREHPTTYREMWDATTVSDGYESVRVKIDRGPIFSRDGELKPDWDVNTRIPIFAMTLDHNYTYADGSPISTDDVYSGKFIEAVAHRLSPIVKRLQTMGKSMARDMENHADAIGNEMGDFLWYQANKTGETRDHTVTIDEANKARALQEKRSRWRSGFEDYFVPPSPK